jgi:hypothetical protein
VLQRCMILPRPWSLYFRDAVCNKFKESFQSETKKIKI